MSTERWHQLDRIFVEALQRPAGERSAFIERACRTDAALKAEALALISAAADSAEFMTTSALELLARTMAEVAETAMPVAMMRASRAALRRLRRPGRREGPLSSPSVIVVAAVAAGVVVTVVMAVPTGVVVPVVAMTAVVVVVVPAVVVAAAGAAAVDDHGRSGRRCGRRRPAAA